MDAKQGRAAHEALAGLVHPDYVLVCKDGKSFKVHGAMLAMHSKVLADVLQSVSGTTIPLHEVEPAAMELVLYSLCFDNNLLNVSDPNEIAGVLEIANKYDMANLMLRGQKRLLMDDMKAKAFAPTTAVE